MIRSQLRRVSEHPLQLDLLSFIAAPLAHADRPRPPPPIPLVPAEPVPEARPSTPVRPGYNSRCYRITGEDRLGDNSLREKCRANLEAITLLARLEAEGRSATEDEKRALVRFVG